jgi:hypothetical protein
MSVRLSEAFSISDDFVDVFWNSDDFIDDGSTVPYAWVIRCGGSRCRGFQFTSRRLA